MKQQFEGLNAVPDMKKHCMIFTGMSGQVTAAKVKMFEQIQEIVGTSAGRFSDGFIQYCDFHQRILVFCFNNNNFMVPYFHAN
jgi:hypothetical protein